MPLTRVSKFTGETRTNSCQTFGRDGRNIAVLENPYVGPASFTKEDSKRFFGRATETRELASLVIARRAVLLYAQSGAGKTSLLQAGLIPELEQRKRVATFPIARV